MALLGMLGRNVGQTLFPRACVFCGVRREPKQALICEDCYVELPWINNACSRCANPVATPLANGVPCAACQRRPPPFTAATAALKYAFPIDAAIKALKFQRKLFYAPAFAHVLMKSMQAVPSGVDALLPVPLHWRRQALRGFNQATELARPIARMTGLPLINNITRVRATPYQSGLTAQCRQRNLRHAFSVRGTIQARFVLIVDDVITTGETCGQIAQLLLDAGVSRVAVLAIARA